jgi:hypothetical protein
LTAGEAKNVDNAVVLARLFNEASGQKALHSIATEIIFGGSRGKTRRSEIWFYFVRVP